MSVILEVTKFHLSLTVMLSFNIKHSSLKLSKCFRMLALSALFLMKMLRLERHLGLGEMLIPDVSLRLALSILKLWRYRQNAETHRHTETQSQ